MVQMMQQALNPVPEGRRQSPIPARSPRRQAEPDRRNRWCKDVATIFVPSRFLANRTPIKGSAQQNIGMTDYQCPMDPVKADCRVFCKFKFFNASSEFTAALIVVRVWMFWLFKLF